MMFNGILYTHTHTHQIQICLITHFFHTFLIKQVFQKIPVDETFQNASYATHIFVILLIVKMRNSVESKLHKLCSILPVSSDMSPFIVNNLHDLFWHQQCQGFPARLPVFIQWDPKIQVKLYSPQKEKAGSRRKIFSLSSSSVFILLCAYDSILDIK